MRKVATSAITGSFVVARIGRFADRATALHQRLS
jgi:hypothetical protein